MEIIRCKNKRELGKQAAERGISLIKEAIRERGFSNIILATGASQFDTIAYLTASGLPWEKITMFHLDEYINLPLSHPASFRSYLQERFLQKISPLKAAFLVDGERDPQSVIQELNAAIERHPIDVCFAGIGENCHLAFNDPPADFDTDQPFIVVELDDACRQQQLGEGWFSSLDEVPTRAISMSIRQICKSRHVILSIPDKRKAAAVQAAVNQPVSPEYPASILQKHPDTAMYLDPDAASLLESREEE